jgi:hypothetical protein
MLSNGNGRKLVAASASPQRVPAPRKPKGETSVKQDRRPGGNQKRAVRIVQLTQDDNDDNEKRRRRLLGRLMESDGRGAISRAAEEYREAGFDFPEEQDVQLQLLEHFNEARARDAIGVLARLLEKEAPIKKPILNQRLRRLEEYADEAATRDEAAMLRRTLRV